jgi:hypothetical protein
VGRRELEAVDRLAGEGLGQGRRRQGALARDDVQAASGRQGDEDVRDAGVDGQRLHHREVGAGREIQTLDDGSDVVDHRAMRHGHALGAAGRAGGVEHVGQVLRRDPDRRLSAGP